MKMKVQRGNFFRISTSSNHFFFEFSNLHLHFSLTGTQSCHVNWISRRYFCAADLSSNLTWLELTFFKLLQWQPYIINHFRNSVTKMWYHWKGTNANVWKNKLVECKWYRDTHSYSVRWFNFALEMSEKILKIKKLKKCFS